MSMTTNGSHIAEPVEHLPVPLAKTAPATSFARGLEPNSFEAAYQMAGCIAQTGMCGVKSAEDALVRIMTGRELGMTTMQSLRAIYVVNGRPGIDASVMQALAERNPDCEKFEFSETTTEHAILIVKRRGKKEQQVKWTIADAKRAGLVKDDSNWAKYPAQMLRARCKADGARLEFADSLFGFYSVEELRDMSPEEAASLPGPQTIQVDAKVIEDAQRANEALKASLLARIASVSAEPDIKQLRQDIADAKKSGNLPSPYIDDVIKAARERFPSPSRGGAATPKPTTDSPAPAQTPATATGEDQR